MKNSFLILMFIVVCSCKKDKVEFYSNANCSDTVSFNDEILPLIQNNCSGCHDNLNGYSLTNHANISSNSSAIIGAMRNSGYKLMPRDGNDNGYALPDSIILRMECWVNQGKKNN